MSRTDPRVAFRTVYPLIWAHVPSAIFEELLSRLGELSQDEVREALTLVERTMDGRPRVWREKAVAQAVGLGVSTIWTLARQHKFPKPVRLTGKAIGWRVSDVERWLADRPQVA